MRRFLIAAALIGAGAAGAVEQPSCQVLQNAYGHLADLQATDTYFAKINTMQRLCPAPSDGASYGAWISYDVCKKQSSNVNAATAASQQAANRYNQRFSAVAAELRQNNCP
ncbi:MAG: hypothetical protein FJ077_15145 [Cyanobacteria bacterium K_DeepCast_35m_m2_023]|nr:hypothetical protein [Cyanobacteria bacterium K_DeepCast_35m_m2_023]